MVRPIALAVLLLAAGAAQADWEATNRQVTAAAKDPMVAAALAAATRLDEALVAGDKAKFVGLFADDVRVNSPFNTIADKAEAERRFGTGALTYRSFHRLIDYAGRRRDDEVVLMGEERYTAPPAHPEAGKLLRRRFTDIWRRQDGVWKLSLRQATVFTVDPKPLGR